MDIGSKSSWGYFKPVLNLDLIFAILAVYIDFFLVKLFCF